MNVYDDYYNIYNDYYNIYDAQIGYNIISANCKAIQQS